MYEDYKYIPVMWPESQLFIGVEYCYLINDDKGIDEFGSSAYFVREDVYKTMTNNEL